VTEAVNAHLDVCDDCAARAARMVEKQEKILKRIKSWDLQARRMAVGPASPPPTPPNIGSGGSATVVESPLPEGVIPGYDVVREIHRGGQGVVYQAVQRSTKRDVAIKVLLEGPFASRAARRRFDREIELVANLKHANIVAVFDSGATRDGRQYCVMDYVEGRRLDQYVREERLDARRMMALFAQVCDAINFAHQRGVIHRDLKPSNILVDNGGVPRVLDFGLAKQMTAPDDPLVSVTGQVVGTLPYLAPEVARGGEGDVDVRADVYALGVLFYELLTGHFPYPVTGQLAAVLQHITETPPTRPSTAWSIETGVSSTITGRNPIDDEVETIALKALAKEPQRRYQTAGDLARDLLRYLAGEPVEAKRDSAWYMLRKTLRRRRGTVIAAAVVLVLLVAWGVTTSYFYAVQKKQTQQIADEAANTLRERDRAIDAEKIAQQQRDKAVEAEKTSQRERDRAIDAERIAHQQRDKAIEAEKTSQRERDKALEAEGRAKRRFDQVRELARAFLFDFHDAIADLPGATPARELLVKNGLKYLDNLSQEAGDDILLKRELATAYAKVGDVQGSVRVSNLGDTAGAMASYRKSLALLESIRDHHPDPFTLLNSLAMLHARIGDMHWSVGEMEKSLAEYRASRKIGEELLAMHRDDVAATLILSTRNQDLGDVLLQMGKREDAVREFEAGLALIEPLAQKPDATPETASICSLNYDRLASIAQTDGRWEVALDLYGRSLKLREAQAAAQPTSVKFRVYLANSIYNMSNLLMRNGHADEAMPLAKRCLAIRQALADADPRDFRARFELAIIHDHLAEIQIAKGDLESALAEQRIGLELREGIVKQDPTNTWYQDGLAVSLDAVGETLRRMERFDEAEAAFRKSIAFRDDLIAKSPSDRSLWDNKGTTLIFLGDVLRHANKTTEAHAIYDQALAIRNEALKAQPDDVSAELAAVSVRDRIGEMLLDENHLDAAAMEFEACHALAKKAFQVDSVNRPTRRCLAVAELKLGAVGIRRIQGSHEPASRQLERINQCLAHIDLAEDMMRRLREDNLAAAHDEGFEKDIETQRALARKIRNELTGDTSKSGPTSEPAIPAPPPKSGEN